jgi:hypothetical protein
MGILTCHYPGLFLFRYPVSKSAVKSARDNHLFSNENLRIMFHSIVFLPVAISVQFTLI